MCPACGSSIVVKMIGDFEILQCEHCSWKLESTVSHVPLVTGPEVLSAKLRWKDGRVSTKEAIAAKKHVPAFADIGISALLQQFGDSTEYDLGELYRPTALQLKEAAEKDGLVVVLRS